MFLDALYASFAITVAARYCGVGRPPPLSLLPSLAA
jgi:hypothetical protein